MKKIFNKKTFEISLGLFMLLIITLIVKNLDSISGRFASADIKEDRRWIVAIDSGHGGIDPGKVGVNDCLEKDINLSIAEFIKEELEKENIIVYMTRESDAGLYEEGDKNKKISDLKKRCEMIEECNADIAVSIHQNSFSDASVCGGQVFCYTGSKEGMKLARSIQAQISKVSGHARQVKENREYYMLVNVKCPIVIAECGFLSNWEEAELLISEDYQKKMAAAVSEGIIKYLEDIKN